ncbi:hypothetical protein BMAA0832 [Burkholderia mallei ATCC 23344]|uniref:Uncharacterized protein n=3 Tax=pseudomallei group TaxID=111527 RepID=A0A0H2WEM2_BURMA|nr:hypothetical protein BMAA0832 [Burkholderia mallei ATCC 23344]
MRHDRRERRAQRHARRATTATPRALSAPRRIVRRSHARRLPDKFFTPGACAASRLHAAAHRQRAHPRESRRNRPRLEHDGLVRKHLLTELAVLVEPLADHPFARVEHDRAGIRHRHSRTACLERHDIADPERSGMRITVSRHGGLFSEIIYLFIFPDLRSGYLFISRRLAIV